MRYLPRHDLEHTVLRPRTRRPAGATSAAARLFAVSDLQASVAGLVPGAAGLGLLPPPGTERLPAAVRADPAWTARLLERRAPVQGTADRRVLATVWWYSVSAVLLTPSLAGLVTGRPLSGRLADTTLSVLSGDRPVA